MLLQLSDGKLVKTIRVAGGHNHRSRRTLLRWLVKFVLLHYGETDDYMLKGILYQVKENQKMRIPVDGNLAAWIDYVG